MKISETQRFWEKVKMGVGCWEWKAALTTTGYGFFRRGEGRPMVKAHRHSWAIHFGEIPTGLWVLHRCDNRKCVRPDHLFLGTSDDNIADKLAKGRQSRTAHEAAGAAKLTYDDVHEIRTAFLLGASQKTIANLYRVSSKTISWFIRGNGWVADAPPRHA